MEEKNKDNLSHGIVNLVSHYVPTESDKIRYQCADVVNQIIEFESGIEGTLRRIREAIGTAEQNDRGSAELTQLKVLTEVYEQGLSRLNIDVNAKRLELVTNIFSAHGLVLDQVSSFDVSGYQFTAKPVSKKMNYIISDLFSYGDIANINMCLVDVTIVGKKKPRVGNIPTRLMIELWENKIDES